MRFFHRFMEVINDLLDIISGKGHRQGKQDSDPKEAHFVRGSHLKEKQNKLKSQSIMTTVLRKVSAFYGRIQSGYADTRRRYESKASK